MSEASIPYGFDDVYYMDKFTEEDFPYEHYLNHDLYGETYFGKEEAREYSRHQRYQHGKHYESPAKGTQSVEHYLRANPALYEEPVPRARPIYPVREQVEPQPHPHHAYQHHYPPRGMQPHQPQHHPSHYYHHQLAQHQMPRNHMHSYNRRDPARYQMAAAVPGTHKKFRKKTNKHASSSKQEKSNNRTRKSQKAQHGNYSKANSHYTSRIRIHGDSWKESSEGFVGLIGKGGHKIGIYRTDKIDPLLPINNHHKDDKDKHKTIDSANFNTYHAGAFWRLFGVEINNVTDFRQTVGDRLIGFAVRPDGDVTVKTISFTANAAVNIVKVLDILEDMRANGFRSRSVEELTTEGTIQAIVEQWMDGNKVIEMSL